MTNSELMQVAKDANSALYQNNAIGTGDYRKLTWAIQHLEKRGWKVSGNKVNKKLKFVKK